MHSSTEKPPEQAHQHQRGDPPGSAVKTALNGSEKPSGAAGIEDGQIGASLGIYTNKVSHTPNQAQIRLSQSDYLPASLPRQIVRFALLSAARDLLLQDFAKKHAAGRVDELRGGRSPERTVGCYRWPQPDSDGVDLLHFPENMAGGVAGVITCASVWACPPCSAKISERRRVSLAGAVEASDYTVIGVTLTLQHHAGESCADVWDRMGKAGKLLTKGRRWLGDKRRGTLGLSQRFGIAGYTRSIEVTVGASGWHVHQHLLLLIDGAINPAALEAAIRREYTGIVDRLGGYAAWDFGVTVTADEPAAVVADYISKTGLEAVDLRQDAEGWTVYHEVAKAPSKRGRQGGRTPLQLLADYLTGDRQAGDLWLEYYWASKGKRQMTHAGAMRDLLGEYADKSDEEIEAEQNEAAIILAHLSHEQWQVVIGNDAMGEVIAICGTGDRRALLAFLLEIGAYSHHARPLAGDVDR